MTCPSCNKPPVRFLRFTFTFDRAELTCVSCGTVLRMAPRWRNATRVYFWLGVAFGILLALNGAAYLVVGEFPLPPPQLILFGLVVEAVILGVFWGQVTYERASGRPPSDIA